MFRRVLIYGGLPVLAGALLVLAPTLAEAAGRGGHGGGGHGGGGHGGGAHFGGGHFGGGYRGGARFGGYRGGAYRGGYGHYGYGHYGYGGLNRHYGFGGYYAYPYFSDSGYYNPYYSGSYDPYPSATSDVPYYSDYTSDGDVMPSEPAAALSAAPAAGGQPLDLADTARPDDRARLTVTVPAGAQLWVDNTPMSSTGPVREFQSPPLTPGVRYAYTVHARWDDNGREVNQTQRVEFTPGERIDVRFPVPPGAAAQAPAVTKG